jgi:hypothetical protein
MSQIKAIDGKIEIIFVQKLLFSKSRDWLKFVPLLALRVISLLRSRRVALGERLCCKSRLQWESQLSNGR